MGDVAAFQDQMPDNFCWGCGAENPDGLQLKSHWEVTSRSRSGGRTRSTRPDRATCSTAGSSRRCSIVMACASRSPTRTSARSAPFGSDPDLWYATASMSIDYLRPTPLETAVSLRGWVTDVDDRFTTVECELAADEKVRARATVRAVRVRDTWRHGAPPA